MTDGARTGLHHVEVGAADLDRSEEFYRSTLGLGAVPGAPATASERWLDAGTALVRLVHVPAGDLGGWQVVNHQRGFRHAGFTVGDVDAWAPRLSAAGVGFTIAPMTALGDVRIVFFQDPDGALVELVSRPLRYTSVWDEEEVAAQRRRGHREPGDDALRLDHAATTVADLGSALALYGDDLGLGRLGQVPHPGDERGYVRSYLAAGEGVLEVFSYDVPPLPPAALDVPRRGLRAVALTTADPDAAAAAVLARGGRELPGDLPGGPAGGPGRLLADADGTVLRLLPPGWSPAP
ncbi:VOC family protein [Kineococcus gypseus]|uniref:VOC family protein n=1 Tax=Kineococcus gypseus TaxID=1637102 RepID=UPI003D7DE9CD